MTQTSISQFMQKNWLQLLPKQDTEFEGNKDDTMMRMLERMEGIKTGFQDKKNFQDSFHITVKVLSQKN